jgi:hypothetical protein
LENLFLSTEDPPLACKQGFGSWVRTYMKQQLHLFVKPNRIEPNRTVAEADRPRLSRQAREILSLLRQGPIRTSELAAIGRQYNARLREVRDFLRPDGQTVDMIERDPGGNNRYAIRPFHGSWYEAELMKKQVKFSTEGVVI